MRVGILISGFGSNMIKLIESCEKENTKASINIVISNNPNAKGLEYAKSKGIRAHSIDHRLFNDRKKFDEAVNEILTNNNIDFICNAGFMRIHGEDFVKNWFNKHLNIHPSLLPSFKGLNTHQRAIDQGVKFSGCTVHMVRSGVDEGPIISQAITSVNSDDNTKLLSERILNLEHRIYPLCLQLFAEDLVSINQDKVIYTKKALEMLSEFKL
jgi:phosphoribosylglycinamide formyltransferase-1